MTLNAVEIKGSITTSYRSDVVPYQFVQKAVEYCHQKEFCKLLVEEGETTTKGAEGSYYTSSGMLIVVDDNRKNVYVDCKTCGKSWEVSGSVV